MTNEEVEQLIATIEEVGLDNAAEVWGMSIKEIIDIYPVEEYLDATNQFPYKEEESTPFTPDYSKTEEFEGEGITSEFLPGDSMVADSITWLAEKAGIPPEAALAMAGVVGKNPKNIKKGGGMLSKFLNDTFASKGLKASQKAKRGSTGEVVKGTSRKLKDSNLRPSIPTKTADRYKSMADKVKGDRATKAVAGTTAAAIVGGAIDRGLSGNRGPDGSLQEAPITDKKVVGEFDNEANNRAMVKQMNDPDGFLQRQMRKKSTSGKTEQFGQEDGRIVKEAPETMGNQYGYHKREGQNFWTVNNDDPYWDTHEMGTGDAWSDAEVKKAPAKELDWSSWFN